MKHLHTGAALLVLALAACAPPAAKDAAKDTTTSAVAAPAAQDAAASAVAAPAALVKGTGEVVVLQPEYAAVTIRHEAIPEYGMGAMTMEFTTADPKQLAGIKVGDQVTFELKGPTDIEKIDVMK